MTLQSTTYQHRSVSEIPERQPKPASRFPMSPFPHGWYKVAYSEDIEPGQAKPVAYFGQELVLFRTEAGIAHVLDAHCPHLGAHLGHGGKVEGDRLRCPFHGWCFTQNGDCADIPYSEQKVPKVKLKQWPVRELNGAVMVYYGPHEDPPWEIPEIAEFDSAEWVAVKSHHWQIRSHPQELLENSVDVAHLFSLHQGAILDASSLNLKRDREVLEHTMQVENSLNYSTKGVNKTVSSLVKSSLYGLGFVRNDIHVSTIVDIDTIYLFFVTPIDDNLLDFCATLLVKKVLRSTFLTKLLGKGLKKDFEGTVNQDKLIWENKAYLEEPVLSKQERVVRQYRDWAKQFYGACP